MIIRFLRWLLLAPVQLLLVAALILAELFRFLPISRHKGLPGQSLDSQQPCSIILLNWNGKHLLAESLPAVQRAISFSGVEHEVIVVDNGSEDGSVGWLEQNHPWVRIVSLSENLGFGEGNNRGVRAASHPIVVLLNNDMIVEQDFLPPLQAGFDDPEVFAVTSQIFFPSGRRRKETGNTQASFRKGYLELSHQKVGKAHYNRKFLPVLWAGGGSSAFRRSAFLELGGFDDIYSPCYVEDTDLSYRAWRRGWKVLLAADSKVLHKHRSSSSKRFSDQALHNLIEERKLWYLWRNYQLRTLFSHCLLFPVHVGSKISVFAYLKSLRRLPRVCWHRLREPRRSIGDRQLFEWVHRPLLFLNHFYPERARQSRGEKLRILLLSAYLPHLGRHGGAGRVFQLLKRVSRHHEVCVVAFVENEDEYADRVQCEACCQEVVTVYRREYDPISIFPYEPFEEFNTRDFRQALEKLLCERDFDVVHFEWTQMAMYLHLFPEIASLITEIEVNYAAHHSQVKVEKNLLKKSRLFYNTLQTMYREVELCRQVDRVVCVTDIDAGYLKGYVPEEKLAVINTGVETSYFAPDWSFETEPTAIVYVGAFRHDPNIDAMLFFHREIWPHILKHRSDAHLYIVGSSPPEAIQKLGESANITVTGFVEDLRDYYRRAQVVIVPLRTGVGIRGKILEGWSAAKAMVATQVACFGIRAVHGKNILIADDPMEFANWTIALLNHPEHCRSLALAGHQVAKEYYEWDQLGEEMNSLYESLVPIHLQPTVEPSLPPVQVRS